MLGMKLYEREVAGEKVFIRNLNGSAEAVRVIELSSRVSKESALMPEIGALLVVCCLTDKDGKQLYTDPAEVRRISSFNFLAEFATAALEVSGLTSDEDLTKNSEAVQ